MNLVETLQKSGFSPDAIDIYRSSKVRTLYPPQVEAIRKGALNGNNLVMSVPTAAGKTLIAELCMLKALLDGGKRCLYIAPLKALASEKYQDFKTKFAPLNISVGLAIGDNDTGRKQLNKNQIIIATAEKVDSLLRSHTSWLIDGLSVLVLDEIHFIDDGSRGPTLEILAARIRQLNPKVQTVALSATIGNAEELAGWLDAALVQSTWRPIPLLEGVFYNQRIRFDGQGVRYLTETASDDMGILALDSLKGKGQVLIFVNSRRSTQAVARRISSDVGKTLTPEERRALAKLSKRIAGNKIDVPKISHELSLAVANGVAFHHAGLKPTQRELIEENFKRNLIKVICCTPTLAAGVNLPARRAVIRDCKRFESGLGQAYIPTSEYKQCAGRAGRPQYDNVGEAVLVAKSLSESETLFDRYIHASPEPITSKLNNESALRMHILSSIAGGYVHDINSMFDFIKHTFLYHQRQSNNMLETVSNIFEFLHTQKFIDKSGYRYFPTTFGSLTSRLYIDPITAIMIRDGLEMMESKKGFTPVGLVHLMLCTPDAPSLNLSKKDLESLEDFANRCHDDLILTPENTPELDDYYTYLSTIKTTWLIHQWIEEDKEETLCEAFGVGPGDIFRHVDATQWLLYGAGAIADLLRKKSLTFRINDLRSRVRYGIREELLEIISLKGVGRIRARMLFKKGYKKVKDLSYCQVDDLAGIPAIGKALAASIIEQSKAKPKGPLPVPEHLNTEMADLV